MTALDMNTPPYRDPGYVERKLEIERRADGSIVLRNPHPLRPVPSNLIEPIRKWAAEAPDRVWLGRRKPSKQGLGEWDLLTYANANAKVNAIAQALLDRGLDSSKPVMILSGNSIEHALMTYGAILAGVPVAPVSPSYSTMSSDFDKLRYVFDLVEPKLVFMQEGAPFERGLAALNLDGVELVTVDGSLGTPFASLLETAPGNAVEESYAGLNFDMVAKYLFTSGSTGMPKAVITTQRMMCVNSVMPKSVTLAEENEEPSILLNWLPWNHCFGGNAILNNLLVGGGTLYIDGGR
ncbi:MAG: acyl-CoA synthetase, partial [Alphaproteobacteria bacterium HGW-Alphaproteobacteria-12]